MQRSRRGSGCSLALWVRRNGRLRRSAAEPGLSRSAPRELLKAMFRDPVTLLQLSKKRREVQARAYRARGGSLLNRRRIPLACLVLV